MDQYKAAARDAALRNQGVLDSAATAGLEKTARLARFIAGSRFAAIHLLDGQLQHRVAEAGGVPLGRTPVQDSMCIQVVEAERNIYLPDATQVPQYADNPYVNRPNPVRFYAATPFRSEAGVTIGTVCVFDYNRIDIDEERLRLLEDLAEHVREHLDLHSRVRQLGHSATHDPLTGLPNRALLSDRLAHAMTRRGRHAGEPALAVLDLDGFKAVNDRLGHQAGDEVLVQVAKRLQAAVRDEDTLARLGGDEFVVLYEQLPEAGLDELMNKLCWRLSSALNEPLNIAGEQLQVAASVGFVVCQEGELGYELLGRADQVMYQQKASRR